MNNYMNVFFFCTNPPEHGAILSDPEPLGWRGRHAGAAHPGSDPGAGRRHVLRENSV